MHSAVKPLEVVALIIASPNPTAFINPLSIVTTLVLDELQTISTGGNTSVGVISAVKINESPMNIVFSVSFKLIDSAETNTLMWHFASKPL